MRTKLKELGLRASKRNYKHTRLTQEYKMIRTGQEFCGNQPFLILSLTFIFCECNYKVFTDN